MKANIHSNELGFTLIELLAVIIIIATLFAIVVSIFPNRAYESKVISKKTTEEILKKQANAYLIQEEPNLPQDDIIPDMINKGYLKEIPIDIISEGIYKIPVGMNEMYSIISSYLKLDSSLGQQYVELPSKVGNFSNGSGGNADFVIEIKIKVDDINTKRGWISKFNTDYNTNIYCRGWGFGINQSEDGNRFWVAGRGVDGEAGASLVAEPSTGVHIFKILREGNSISLYVNDEFKMKRNEIKLHQGFNTDLDMPVQIGRMWWGLSGWTWYANNDIYYLKIWKNTTDTTTRPMYEYYFSNAGENKIVKNYGTAGSSGDGQAYGGALQVK